MFVIVMRWIVIVIWWNIMRWTRYALALDDYTMALPQPNGPLHTHMYEVRPRKDHRDVDQSRMRCHLVGCAHMASLGRLTQMKADTKDLIEFLVGLAWTGVIVWFTATSYQHINELGFVILFTSGAFGWMPLARSEYPRAPGTLGAWLVLECGVRLWSLRSRCQHGQRAGVSDERLRCHHVCWRRLVAHRYWVARLEGYSQNQTVNDQ